MRKNSWYGLAILLTCVLIVGCSPAFKTSNWQASNVNNGSHDSMNTAPNASVQPTRNLEEADVITSIVHFEDGWVWYGGYEYYDQAKVYVKPGNRKHVKTISCELVATQKDWYILRFRLPADQDYSCFNFYDSKSDNWHIIMPGSEACSVTDDVMITEPWVDRRGRSQGSCYAITDRFVRKRGS